jgi:translin
MNNLETIVEQIRTGFEDKHEVRELALKRSRQLVSMCAKSIRAMHRSEWESARRQLAAARDAAHELSEDSGAFPDIYHAGYTQDSLKEYVEAALTYALMQGEDLPDPVALNVELNTWINGLAEAATEMRRRILDILRHGHSDEAERLLDVMNEIYSQLVTLDFTDSITGGLRRRTDTVRAVLERTRGDVTNSFRQAQLESALAQFEARMTSAE